MLQRCAMDVDGSSRTRKRQFRRAGRDAGSDADELCFLLTSVQGCLVRVQQDYTDVRQQMSMGGNVFSSVPVIQSSSALLRSCLQLYNALENRHSWGNAPTSTAMLLDDSSQQGGCAAEGGSAEGLNFLEDAGRTMPLIQCVSQMADELYGMLEANPALPHVEEVKDPIRLFRATLNVLLEEMEAGASESRSSPVPAVGSVLQVDPCSSSPMPTLVLACDSDDAAYRGCAASGGHENPQQQLSDGAAAEPLQAHGYKRRMLRRANSMPNIFWSMQQ